jgi:hypothetical protein
LQTALACKYASGMPALTPEQIEGRLAALEIAATLVLRGRRFREDFARGAVSREVNDGRLSEAATAEAVETLQRILGMP